jgi:type I restriction enzyme S subunit
MIAGFENIKLENLCFIKGGKRLPKGETLIDTKTNHPYIRARDIRNGKINFTNPKYLSKSVYEKIKRYIVRETDVVITIVGANIGDVGYITTEFDGANLTENAVKLSAKPEKLNPLYLKYVLLLDAMKEYFQVVASGAAQGKLGLYKIKTMEIPVPLLSYQHKIAKILSAYDDLIENNLKRIKLLEEMAQITYEEWFVRMKFPGYKTAVFDDETDLPTGWKNLRVENYVKTLSKGPSLNYESDGAKYPVLNQSCIRNGEIELDKVLYSEKLSKNKQECYLEINDILINSMGQGTLGRVSKNVSIKEKFIIHNCITFLRAKNEYSQFLLFYFIASHKPYFESIAQGSTGQSTLKTELVSNLKLKLPSREILNRFDKIVSPIWKNIGALKIQNQHLKEARDILLPRLMTGMVDVDEILK